ncbi:ankyrin repeat domain-containing protein 54-like [Trichogramma pretiosum]|uniref:ankyrin repeat domain-containing protein 54-like n=1 Tax=Trichogramma pretiosum TaxID=7493 RepID=UPI0006C95D93|nr:ankyrin repeat domain-containing protein 54-like [Trichogramma pretiosum]
MRSRTDFSSLRSSADASLAERGLNAWTVLIYAANDLGNTPLHDALNRDGTLDDRRLVELLLRRGADPNPVNEAGKTPLHMICKRASSQDDLLAMFPRQGQLDVVDKLARTPLRWAVENLVPRVVDILLDHGASLFSFVFPTASDFAERLDVRAFSSIYTLILN